jgi:hypothetical protein
MDRVDLVRLAPKETLFLEDCVAHDPSRLCSQLSPR